MLLYFMSPKRYTYLLTKNKILFYNKNSNKKTASNAVYAHTM